jgi:hypothetical protein
MKKSLAVFVSAVTLVGVVMFVPSRASAQYVAGGGVNIFISPTYPYAGYGYYPYATHPSYAYGYYRSYGYSYGYYPHYGYYGYAYPHYGYGYAYYPRWRYRHWRRVARRWY